MKFELLSENKLKIVLQAEELAEYGLTYANLSYDNVETRLAFRDLLKHAKESVGVSFESSRLLVEARPTSSLGCVMTVTRRGQKASSPPTPRRLFFKFADFDDFLDFKNYTAEFSNKYSVHFHENRAYISAPSDTDKRLLHAAMEFGEKCSFRMDSMLEEHETEERIVW